uniref:Kinesin motor domain-containing protein n=1 Tax=Scleropages formosus TaxID=113540 RepID=A0A8C9RJ59_SCLFO
HVHEASRLTGERGRVKVATRIRPLLPAEILQNQQVCVRVVPGAPQVLLARDRAFAFDFAFGPKAQQDEVYCTCVKPLVASLMDGYNVTVFAYGQTGSGKTYTIGAGHFGDPPLSAGSLSTVSVTPKILKWKIPEIIHKF